MASMGSVAGDPLESYLARYRLRVLTEEWLDVVARRRPEDPFSYLVGLINAYNREGVGLVTCENKWCEMVIPIPEYEAHLSTCSEEGKWVKCTRCNLRVEASRMRQHKRNCKLESCPYCGEMVVPRLRDMCPHKMKADAERAFSKKVHHASKKRDNVVPSKGNTTPPLQPPIVSSSADAPLHSDLPLSFPDNLRDRLICIQDMWRNVHLKERFQDIAFKSVWRAVELYREKQATKEQLAIPRDNHPKTALPPRLGRYAGLTVGCISVSRFEALAKTITSGAVVEFETAERIISMAVGILAARPPVQRVTIPEGGDVVVVGDLHGQMKDLCEAIVLTGGLPNPRRYLVFNGDFVDRGSNGLGVILYVFALLCAFPEFVFINRGNHEDARVNAEYGFHTEVCGKYGMETAKRLLELLVDSYEAMPLVTLLDGMIFVSHGGVPRVPVTLERIESLRRIRDIPTAGELPEDDQIIVDILWNDPVEKFRSRQLGLRHQAKQWRTSKRGCGAEYLAPVTEEFLRLNHLQLVVRSHEEVQAGFERIHNGKCCTVFSASNYCGVSGNRGAIAVFAKGSLHPVFHTWYVRNDEVGIDLTLTQGLLRDILPTDGDNDEDAAGGGKTPESPDETQTSPTAGKKRGSEDAETRSGVENSNDDVVAETTLTPPSSVEGRWVSRLNALMILAEIIFRKRYALLSGFVAADYSQSGTIYKIEWCEVMRSVLEIDLPWYYLCKFVAVPQELDGVPIVQYTSFLRRFDANFSSQYLLSFQLACVRRVFGEMDLPDDLLRRLDNADAFEAAAAASLSYGRSQAGASEHHKGGLIPLESPRGSSKSRSLPFLKTHGSDTARSRCSSNPAEGWRARKIDFNVLVSILRSESRVAAALEDNAMYALFQYLDQEECGHVVLGNLVDLVETVLMEEGVEIVLLGTSSSLDTGLVFSVADPGRGEPPRGTGAASSCVTPPPTTPPKESRIEWQTDAGTEVATATPAAKGQAKQSEIRSDGGTRVSSLAVAATPENTETHEMDSGPGPGHSVNRSCGGNVDDSVVDALWLYPSLLRLHEGLDYGSLTSLRKNFVNLNRTGDGKLTFDQLNVAMQLMGRHMREPLTLEQSKRIFSAIRLGGRRLTMAHSLDALYNTSSDVNGLMSVVLTSEDLTTVQEGIDTAESSYITINEFLTFFSITSMGRHLKRMRSTNDSLKPSRMDENCVSLGTTGRKHDELRGFLEDLRSWPHLEVLRDLTVESFSSRFDGGTALVQALRELLRSSPVPARLMTGPSTSHRFALSLTSRHGTGVVCPPAGGPQKQAAPLGGPQPAQEPVPNKTRPTSGPAAHALATVPAVEPEATGETRSPVGSSGGTLKPTIPAKTHTDLATAAPSITFTPARGSGDGANNHPGAAVKQKRRPDKIHANPQHISTPPTGPVSTSDAHQGAPPRRALARHPPPRRGLSPASNSSSEHGVLRVAPTTTPPQRGGGTHSVRKVRHPNRHQPKLPIVRGALLTTLTPPSARVEHAGALLKRK